MFGFRQILDSLIISQRKNTSKKITKYMFFAIMLEIGTSKN